MPEHRTLWLSAESSEAVRRRAMDADVFGTVALRDGEIVCEARDAAAPAEYAVFEADGRLWAALRTADRWLSQSIEQDLVHTGDKMEDLVEEELVELGFEGACRKVEHFRDDDKRFVFRTAVPVRDGASPSEVAAVAAAYLLAMEAAFRPLGDMEADEEE